MRSCLAATQNIFFNEVVGFADWRHPGVAQRTLACARLRGCIWLAFFLKAGSSLGVKLSQVKNSPIGCFLFKLLARTPQSAQSAERGARRR